MDFIGAIGVKEYFQDESGLIYWRVPSVREAVRAGKGRKLVISDLSQIEVKLMAFMSQDKWLINAINSGKDIHNYMASKEDGCGEFAYDVLAAGKKYADNPQAFVKLYLDPETPGELLRLAFEAANVRDLALLADVLQSERSGVKTVTFGVPYGASEKRVGSMIRKRDPVTKKYSEMLEDAIVRASKLIKKYFSNARQLEAWLINQKKMALTFGYTRCVRGRIRFYPVVDEDCADSRQLISQIGRWAGNHPIQSSCSSMLKDAIDHVYRALRGGIVSGPRVIDCYIMLCAHDELILNAHENCVEQARAILKAGMEHAYSEVCMEFAGKMHYLTEIKNEVKVSVEDYWSKD